MTPWLLDTNLLSELRRPKPDRSVLRWMNSQPLEALHISTVALAEIRFGIEQHSDFNRRALLQSWLDGTIRPMFKGRVLTISEDVMVVWRLMLEAGRQSNHTFPQPDLIIAATAANHGMTIVSRDTKIYERAGVPVFNPWQS